MKRLIIVAMAMGILMPSVAQEKKFGFKFYGRIRTDFFYNSRANEESVDGLFLMYPKDVVLDPSGQDINSSSQSSFYMLYTRVGVDIKAPRLGKADVRAKVELDFRGSGSTFAVPRVREAYVALDWKRAGLLIGQTWHPMFGEVKPTMLNLSTGAPFQPFNRSPLIKFTYAFKSGFKLTAAAIWQMQFNSMGPNGKSHKYLKNGCVPELFAGLDYHNGALTVGGGVEMLSIKPRQTAVVDGKTFKVNERVTSVSGELHAKVTGRNWSAAAKSVLANNMTQASMLGGFGVVDENPVNGERTYTPFLNSATWVNFVYGHKWQPGVFIGYMKNLGCGKPITGETFGVGLDVDQIVGTNWQLALNLPSWKFGVEFSTSTAFYGDMNPTDGRVYDTRSVTNYRVVGVVQFSF